MYTYHSIYPMKKYWAEAWRTRPYDYFILVCFSTGQLDWNINTFFMNFPGSLPSQSNLSTLFVSHCQRAVMHTISVYQFTYTQTFTYYIYKNIPSLLNALIMHEYQDKKILANLSRSLIHNQKHQTKGTDFIWVIDLILILFQNAPFNSPLIGTCLGRKSKLQHAWLPWYKLQLLGRPSTFPTRGLWLTT